MTTRMKLTLLVCAALICRLALAFVHSEVIGIAILLLLVLTGFIVRRWWVLLVALGPLAALVYLEVSGYVGPQEEYADRPLLSPPGLFGLVWIVVLLLLGVWLGNAGEWLRRTHRGRRVQKGRPVVSDPANLPLRDHRKT